MTCPKCGSSDVIILSSEVLTFKCRKCGHTWSYDTRTGLVNAPCGQIHWTEQMYYKEQALEDAKDLLRKGESQDKVLEELKQKYGQYLDETELRKIIKKAQILMKYM